LPWFAFLPRLALRFKHSNPSISAEPTTRVGFAGTGAGRLIMTFVVGRPKGKTRCSKTWRELGDTLVVEGEVICGSRFKDDELLWIEG